MYSLREIKSKIFLTDAKNYLYDGMCISEPIMTKQNDQIIDNFFIYACDDTRTNFTRPLLCFGINSEKNTLIYVNQEIQMTEETFCCKSHNTIDTINRNYKQYSKIYPLVREFAYKDCNTEQAQLLQEYLDKLFIISGDVLWEFYNKLFPSFFEWANNIE